MQPAPTPYWPSIVVVPPSPGLFGASRIALMIFGTATLFASCIAGMG